MTTAAYGWLFAWSGVVLVAAIGVVGRYFTRAGQARAELASGQEYRALAEEYRRLSDLAITAQEHTDLRLADMSVRIDEVRDQLDKMRRILTEVE
jgi:hypothetical protein